MNFKEWFLNEASNPGSKTGLYPVGYGGIGLYPPQWYLTRSADAIFYISNDDRIYNFKTHKMVNKYLNSGDGGLWSIKNLLGPTDSNKKINKDGMAMNNGEGGMFNINHIKGKPTYTKNKEFVPDEGEGGMWSIKHIKGDNPTPKFKTGEKSPWDISKLKGKPTYTKNKEFVPDEGEGGMWSIKHIKKS
jgi:hypothetical protein